MLIFAIDTELMQKSLVQLSKKKSLASGVDRIKGMLASPGDTAYQVLFYCKHEL